MFDPIWKLILGLGTGIVFGILLQKGGVAKFRVILGQFLFTDWTVVKVMGTAICVGGVGIYAMLPTEAVELHVKPLIWGGVVAGGLCFGIGMATFGYCPGTGVAACGEGRRDAMMGVLGMLIGAGVYVALYPTIKPWLRQFGDAGSVTLPDLTGTSPWWWLAAIVVAAGFLFIRSHRSGTTKPATTKSGAPKRV